MTLSRSMGSQGSRIAELLADHLGVPCFGYALLDGIVKEAKSDKFLMALVDERAPNALEDWVHALFSKGVVSRSSFYRRLIKTTLLIAKTGGVIIGRGAHLVLANNPKVFRLRVEGSFDVRVQRVAERESLSLKKAKELVNRTDAERKKYVKELFKRYPHERAYYDLVVNSDTLTPFDAVDIVLHAMEKMGYIAPVEAASAASSASSARRPPIRVA